MFKIKIITIGKIKDKSFLSLSQEYLKRLKPFASIKMEELKAESFSKDSKEKAKKIESERIAKALARHKDQSVFLLDENGKEFDSLRFARFLDKEREIVLVIAGSLGFTDDLKHSYPTISLSQLTFPHEMARVVLLEQIYRSATILSSKEYHY